MKKSIAATTAVAAALGGVAAGAVITAGPAAIAQETTTEEAPDGFIEERLQQATESIREALSGLVDDGTITDLQADSVAETLAAERPFGHGRGHGQRGHGFGLAGSAELTELLGLEANELFEALSDGSTLAEVAEAQGVSPDAVADLLVSEAEERLNSAADQGFIDEEAVDEKLADIEEAVDDLLNGELPEPGEGFGRRGFGRGFGGPGNPGDTADDTVAS